MVVVVTIATEMFWILKKKQCTWHQKAPHYEKVWVRIIVLSLTLSYAKRLFLLSNPWPTGYQGTTLPLPKARPPLVENESKLGQQSVLESQLYFYAKEINQGGYISVFKKEKKEAIYLLISLKIQKETKGFSHILF